MSRTVLDGYKVNFVFVWPAEFAAQDREALTKAFRAATVKTTGGQEVLPGGDETDRAFAMAFAKCAPGNKLSAVVQEVQDGQFGAHSTVTLVLPRGITAMQPYDPTIFVPPEDIVEEHLPFAIGVQLLKVAAAQAGTAVPQPSNPARKKHSSGALF
eukprot:TRINITY_DN3270_c0_g1_i1.p2 TRINITY_DN3270_c0_g1~~TRINITY_DN3270_c0_g1_i1.p2  ORF type:complete len:156 (-),score=22.08 TRINITY_DN3270_c0_g1_i1:326-793(-)